jgi:GIY-YIG catalytic domain-containing protein
VSILLNDILKFKDLNNIKIRFVLTNNIIDPIELFKYDRKTLLDWQFWNYAKKKSFRKGEIAIGFVKIEGDKWLLFDISKITNDLNILSAVGYEYEQINEFEKYFGRVIIEFKNKSQNMVRRASSVIDNCKVLQILEDTFDNDIFPGYENVNISWKELQRVLNKGTWKTALENQKGVYLLTDKSNGKMYVGSAYGKNMIHGRWSAYINNGHGGNKELKELDFHHIKENFYYSILDIYKSTVHDETIIKRESWWKKTLRTREFGYNGN